MVSPAKKLGSVFVVDDNDLMRESMTETARRAGYDTVSFPDPTGALEELKQRDVDVIVTDLMMPKMGGLEFLMEAKRLAPETQVVMVTAFATVENAVRAMKEGAFDYITKPFQADALEVVLEKAVRHRNLLRENEYLRARLDESERGRGGPVVGGSRAMRELYDQIRKVAASSSTVLIQGESGTGKEVVARTLHGLSPRADMPFYAVNCAALSAGLLESELFGHEKGAFTGADRMRKGRFELANGGTLLLDEVSEIDPGLQAKLLRVLQERSFERVGSSVSRSVDVRVLATTNRDLKQAIAEKTFREDLYYRLNVVILTVPPLREHRDDISELAGRFVETFNRDMGKTVKGLSDDAVRLLQSHTWPGNIRELENAIERAMVLTGGDMLGAGDFKGVLQDGALPQSGEGGFLPRAMGDIEREHYERMLRHFEWNQQKTADALGVSDRTLRSKIKDWGLKR